MSNGTTKGKIRATKLQKKAVAIFANNAKKGIIEPEGVVLAKAGYDKSIQNTPKQITKNKTFQQLLDRDLPEKVLTKKHKSMLNSAYSISSYDFDAKLTNAEIKEMIERVPNCKFIRVYRGSGSNVTAYYYKPDNMTQFKALELGYKLRKKLGNDAEDGEGKYSDEIKAVIVHIRKVLPQAGQ